MTHVCYDDCSVRVILVILSGCQRDMTPALERIARGERPVAEGVDYNDFDAWNARFVGAGNNGDPAAAIEELKASKDAFLGAAQMVPEDRFEEGRAAHRILLAAGTDH